MRKPGEQSTASLTEISHPVDGLNVGDAEIETWLRHDVARAYDAYKADPARAIDIEQAMTDIKFRIARNGMFLRP